MALPLTVPMTIFGKKIKLQVNVVENNIPLLISRPTMTQLGMILDTANHMVSIEGKQFNLEFTESGHYTIPVCEWTNQDYNIFHLETLAESKAEKARKAQKLHCQFAHVSKERLLQLLRDGDCYNKEFLQEVENCCDSCQFCQKYRKQKPNPIVCFPKAAKFNQVVSMDLRKCRKANFGFFILMMQPTDTAAAIIKDKKKNIIVDRIVKIWLAYFGAPKKFQ